MTIHEGFQGVPVQGNAPVQGGEGYEPPHRTTPIPFGEIQEQLAQAAYRPDEMPTEPAPTRGRLLLRGSVLRRAGAAVAGVAFAGAALASAVFGGNQTVEGTPSAAGVGGGNTGAEAPAVPGPDQDGSQSPEKETGIVNLCDKVELKELLEWTGNEPTMFDMEDIDCTGTPPPESASTFAGVDLAAYGLWRPTSGGNTAFIDAMEVAIFEDGTPSGSAFENHLVAFPGGSGAHVKTVDGRDAVVASAPATGRHKNKDGSLGDVTHGIITIAKFRQDDGSFRDLTIKTTIASGIGGQGETIQEGVEKAHEMALPDLAPVAAE